LDIYEFLREQFAHLQQTPELHPPLLSGHDLLALGVPQGPRLGALLAELREKQLQDEIKTPEQARRWILQRQA
jgi:poly(A) polymerase